MVMRTATPFDIIFTFYKEVLMNNCLCGIFNDNWVWLIIIALLILCCCCGG